MNGRFDCMNGKYIPQSTTRYKNECKILHYFSIKLFSKQMLSYICAAFQIKSHYGTF